MHNYFWSYVLGAIGLILLFWMIPKYRQQLAKSNLPLEQRYAKEIANGEAVIIPKDSVYFKKMLILAAIGCIGILLIQKFNRYISFLNQTCTSIHGWNVLFVQLGALFVTGLIGSLIIIIISFRNYQKILNDGYAPSRNTKTNKDQMAFKLTPKIKVQELAKLVINFIFGIYIMSLPFILLYIHLETSTHKPTSIYALNDYLQKACLNDLKKKS